MNKNSAEPTDLEGKSCRFEFFGSLGGDSLGKYASLNVGLHVGDEASIVLKNREHLKDSLGASSLLSALQIHGTRVHIQDVPLDSDLELDGYDALVTSQPGIALMVQHADCQPVLLHERSVGVIAAVHNGWRGSVKNILAKVVSALEKNFCIDTSNLKAIIGPSLGPCCAEFVNYSKELPEDFLEFKVENNFFDFWQISKYQLMKAGLIEGNIDVTGECTRCSSEYFSYRRAVQDGDGVTGRNGAVIVLNEGREQS